jgi:uncharacterized protein YkwD
MSKIEAVLPRQTRLSLLAAVLVTAALLGTADVAPAAACTRANAMPTHANHRTVARATLCLINRERRSRGLRPLRSSGTLAAAARGHSRDMVRRRYFSHTAPGGARVVQRIRRGGYLRSAKRWRLGENLGWGSGGDAAPRAMVRAWMNSPPHRKAILTASYRDAGVGVSLGLPLSAPGLGATYTVDFGTRR